MNIRGWKSLPFKMGDLVFMKSLEEKEYEDMYYPFVFLFKKCVDFLKMDYALRSNWKVVDIHAGEKDTHISKH